MDKSLTPLIAVIALVILLTLIILNSDFSGNQPAKQETRQVPVHKMNLRPGKTQNPLRTKVARKESSHNQLINIGENLGKAKTLLADGKTKEAEDILRTLLVFKPEHIQALSLLGGILYYSNRYDEAEIIFRRQIQLDPRNHLAYNRLGSTLAKQNKYQKAIESSSIAVGMNPESGEAHINLAGMYSMLDKKKKAMEHFKKAHKLLGYAVLLLSYDKAFNNIRTLPEFQAVLSKAKQASGEKEQLPGIPKKQPESQEKPLFKSTSEM